MKIDAKKNSIKILKTAAHPFSAQPRVHLRNTARRQFNRQKCGAFKPVRVAAASRLAQINDRHRLCQLLVCAGGAEKKLQKKKSDDVKNFFELRPKKNFFLILH